MPSVPPLVADLDAEVTQRCGLVLADAGLFLRALDATSNPVTPVVRQGLRRGAKAVGLSSADPLNLQDSDIANLSPFALERIIDEGELFALQQCLLGWWRVTQGEQSPLSSTLVVSGWRRDQKDGVRNRVSELKAECEKPYREPSNPTVVANPGGFPILKADGTTIPPAGSYPPYGFGYGRDGWDGWGWGSGF